MPGFMARLRAMLATVVTLAVVMFLWTARRLPGADWKSGALVGADWDSLVTLLRTRPLSLGMHPPFKPHLSCNPTFISRVPWQILAEKWGATSGLSHSHDIGRCRDDPNSDPHQFTSVDDDTNQLLIKGACNGTVMLFGSNGRQVMPLLLGTAPASVDLRDWQQVVVQCTEPKMIDVHVRAVLDRTSTDRARRAIQANQGSRTRPHVLVLMVDSVSRGQFIRQFPKTVQTLQGVRRGEISGSHIQLGFERFSTAAVGTNGNFLPVLTGYSIGRWQSLNHELNRSNVSYVDRYLNASGIEHDGESVRNLFMEFKAAGYVTSLMDQSGLQWTSSLGKLMLPNGTDNEILEVVTGLADYNFYTIMDPLIRNGTGWDARLLYTRSDMKALCAGRQSLEELEFQRLSQLLDMATANSVPLFSVSVFNTGHEPAAKRAPSADAPLSTFIQRTLSAHPDVMVVLMSDHGLGYGPFAASDLGAFEGKLPTLFVSMPASFLAVDHLQNAIANEERLVFPLDIFHTLRWVASPDAHDRGLFASEIDAKRDCDVVEPEYDVNYKFCGCAVRLETLMRPSYPLAVSALNFLNMVNEPARNVCEHARYAAEPRSMVLLDRVDRNNPFVDRLAVQLAVTTNGLVQRSAVETFTAYYVRHSEPPRWMHGDGPESFDLAVGTHWDSEHRHFLGPVSVVDMVHGTPISVLMRPIKNVHQVPRGSHLVLLHADHALDPQTRPVRRRWWMQDPVVHLDDIRLVPGPWAVLLRHQGRTIGSATFAVVNSVLQPRFDQQELIGRYWAFDTLRRESEFGMFEQCTPAGMDPALCLCGNVSLPQDARS
ncbi:Sulfatase N-terminal domain-containing protein [Plasmodiophora brassicae]